MNAMLKALLFFLVGCLVLGIVIYVAHLIIAMLGLPPQLAQIVMLILALIGLVALIYLCVNVFRGGGGGEPFN